MGNLRVCLAVAVFGLGACGGDGGGSAQIDASIDSTSPDAKVFMDAPPPTFDFSCTSNTTPPSTAAAMITLSGSVQAFSASGASPVAGASVKACAAGASNCSGGNTDGNATSANDGSWSIGPFTTGGVPQDDFIEMTASGFRTVYTYPAAPFVADQGSIPAVTFDAQTEGLLSTLGGCDTTNAIIGLAMLDCANNPITDSTNVTITVKQGGTAVTGTTVVDLGSLSAQAAGTFLVCGVPANAATEVSAVYKTTNLLAHTVKTVVGTTTATILRPGY